MPKGVCNMVDISTSLKKIIEDENCSSVRALFILSKGEVNNEQYAIRNSDRNAKPIYDKSKPIF